MQKFLNYKDALRYIYNHTNFERKQMPKYNLTTLDLSRIETLMTLLGNPHTSFKVILIAGTKGKGSTAAMTESMLRKAGVRTGLYSSPHLHSFRERIRINGELISQQGVVARINKIRPFADTIAGLTAWEIMTALAFVSFSEEKIEVAVLEVGLGGRLDATNITDPVVSVITSISYDHTQLLGNTLTLIAGEKAGIIRHGGAVVSAMQFPEAMTTIEDICAARDASLVVAGEDNPWRVGRVSLAGQTIYWKQKKYQIPLLGKHQASNAIVALTILDEFERKTDFKIEEKARQDGLASVQWFGRMEILSREPLIIADSAMNGDSAKKLRESLESYFPGRNVVFIFGASNDHDYRNMLKALLPICKTTIATQANHPRATPPAVLVATAHTLGESIDSAPSVKAALLQAIDLADERDLICVTGSLFCAAEAREVWAEKHGDLLPETDPV